MSFCNTTIAVELLQLTYLHRTQPLAPAIEILNPLQLRTLSAKSPKPPKVLTVSWGVEALAKPAVGIAFYIFRQSFVASNFL